MKLPALIGLLKVTSTEVAGPVPPSERTADVTEAVVHGVLHLCGYDHEADDGEMLDLQDRIMGALS